MSLPTIILVRRANGDGYAASGGGKRATCTWSHEEAARRCAAKNAGESGFGFELVAVPPSQREADRGVLYVYHCNPVD